MTTKDPADYEYTRNWLRASDPIYTSVIVKCNKCHTYFPSDFSVPIGFFDKPHESIRNDAREVIPCGGTWIKIQLKQGEKEDMSWYYDQFTNMDARPEPLYVLVIDKNNQLIHTREYPGYLDIENLFIKENSGPFNLEFMKNDHSYTMLMRSKTTNEVVFTNIILFKSPKFHG